MRNSQNCSTVIGASIEKSNARSVTDVAPASLRSLASFPGAANRKAVGASSSSTSAGTNRSRISVTTLKKGLASRLDQTRNETRPFGLTTRSVWRSPANYVREKHRRHSADGNVKSIVSKRQLFGRTLVKFDVLESSPLGLFLRRFDHAGSGICVGHRTGISNHRRDRQRRFAAAATDIEHCLP